MDWTRRDVRVVATCVASVLLLTMAYGEQESTVTFFQVRALAGYEGLTESNFPGMDNEATVMVVPGAKVSPGDLSAWLKDLFSLESVDPLDLETVVQVYSPEVSGAQPSFFDTGESGEFRVWWFGGASAPLPGWLMVAVGVDFQGQELIPPLQVLCAPTEMVLVARRVESGSDSEELQSLNALKEPSLIFVLAITAELLAPSGQDFRPVVDRYMYLRGQQKPTGGTVLLAEDPGYDLIRRLFAQHFKLSDLEYGANKRVPVSSGGARLEVERYDTPPRLARGNEAIRAALLRAFGPEDLPHIAHTTVKVLISEKGSVEDVLISPMVNQEMRKRWWRAVKLLRWEPATFHGRPVRAWAVIPTGEALK